MAELRDIDDLFAGLAGYAEDSDRSDPLRFIGRDDELERLLRTVQRVAESNPRSATRVVHGIPGMGKTALCKEFQRRINGTQAAGRTAVAIELDCADFDLPPLKLVQKIAAKLPARMDLIPGAGEWARRTRKAAQAAAEAALLFGAGKTGREAMHRLAGLDDQSDLETCINAYAAGVWPAEIVVALVADEFQACPVTNRVRGSLRVLDSCTHEARIQMTFFGLPPAAALLRHDLGLSRMTENAELPLAPLVDSEGREVVVQTLEALGLSTQCDPWTEYLRDLGVEPKDWATWKDGLADEIAEQAANFPQHLTAGLLAMARALIDHRGSLACGPELAADATERFGRIKDDYYARRLGDLAEHGIALGALSSMPAAMESVAIDLVVTGAEGRGVPISRAQAAAILGTAVHRSVIESRSEKGGVVYAASSIPSMRSWLAARFEEGAQENWPAAEAILNRHAKRLDSLRSRCG